LQLQKGRKLPTFQSGFEGLGQEREVGDQTVGLTLGIILREGDKIIVLAIEKLPQIFCAGREPVVGGNGQ
jgi:hypothetical protein